MFQLSYQKKKLRSMKNLLKNLHKINQWLKNLISITKIFYKY